MVRYVVVVFLSLSLLDIEIRARNHDDNKNSLESKNTLNAEVNMNEY